MSAPWINYMLEANLVLLAFLAIYYLLLRRESDFRFARLLLLGGLMASFLFPLFHLGRLAENGLVQTFLQSYGLPEFTASASSAAKVPTETAPIPIGQIIYLAGVAMMAAVTLFNLVRMVQYMREGYTTKQGSLRIVQGQRRLGTFSFFRWIYVDPTPLTPAEQAHIIRHESVHVQQWHTLDLLLVRLVHIVFWFNPFLLIYKKIFVQLHEYEADARAVEDHDLDDYCSLLARAALMSADIPIANHFGNNLTVKRIRMMKSNKRTMKPWKRLMMLPLIGGIFFLISYQEQVLAQSMPVESSPSQEIFDMVDEFPVFDQGRSTLVNFLGKEISYPKAARKNKVEGKVITSFVVEKDGSISAVNVVKSLDKLCDDEALRAIQAMPRWTPAKVGGKAVRAKMVLPINFNLGS